MLKRFLLLAFIGGIIVACDNDLPTYNGNEAKERVFAKVLQPGNNTKATCGETLALKIQVEKPDSLASIEVFWNDSLLQNYQTFEQEIALAIPTKNAKVGRNDIKVIMHQKNGKMEEDNRSIYLFSDVYATILVAQINQTLPHQKTSYTQGLEFYQGQLYEGTGLRGESILAKVDLQSGNIEQKIDLPNNVFGEGITILNDKIYQLTWQARLCYEYDAKTFEKIREFSYFGEGWGMCNNGKEIIMSNGTSEITFHDPITFEEKRSISVFDSSKEYVNINELEYYDGIIYANVYQTNYILKIDPKTGKVLAKIDCSEVVRKGRDLGDVLNGIAINKKTGKIYITGKKWPKLFEVEFVKPS